MSVLLLFFWLSALILFYSYAGYGLLIFGLNSLGSLFVSRKKRVFTGETLPVTLVVTAYNEELILQQKIENSLALEYPAGKLHLIFITDGSADSSAELISRYPSITLLHQPERKGKYAAVKRAMQ